MKRAVSYKTSGVDIAGANRFVRGISGLVQSTHGSQVISRKGAFASLFSLSAVKGMNKPVLVSSTDGVGTKLLVANTVGKHDTIGIDLVAMNVNDILCVGAKPLFFLDYIACGKLDGRVLKDVVKGVVKGCRQAGCALIGGETAEMPGMYKPQDYDVAGFAVGVVDESKIIDGSKIAVGDQIIGLASSGLHSNGYSLARKVFSAKEQKNYAKELLAPTKIYVDPILKLIERFKIKGLAHNTGGAFYDKLTKIVPDGKCLSIDRSAWKVPAIFQTLQQRGKVSDKEMFRTFNMGIGMIVIVGKKEVSEVSHFLKREKVKFDVIGRVVKNDKSKIIIQ